MHNADFKRNWRDIATSFLKIGGIAYGGPAIMGIMQAELQESAVGVEGSAWSKACRW